MKSSSKNLKINLFVFVYILNILMQNDAGKYFSYNFSLLRDIFLTEQTIEWQQATSDQLWKFIFTANTYKNGTFSFEYFIRNNPNFYKNSKAIHGPYFFAPIYFLYFGYLFQLFLSYKT